MELGRELAMSNCLATGKLQPMDSIEQQQQRQQRSNSLLEQALAFLAFRLSLSDIASVTPRRSRHVARVCPGLSPSGSYIIILASGKCCANPSAAVRFNFV